MSVLSVWASFMPSALFSSYCQILSLVVAAHMLTVMRYIYDC